MNNLTVLDNSKKEVLISQIGQENFLAITGKKINQLTDAEIHKAIQSIILAAYLRTGQRSPDSTLLQNLVLEISSILKNKFKNLSIEAIRYAIQQGSSGFFTSKEEITIVTIVNFFKWVTAYQIGEYNEMKKKYYEQLLPTPEKLTPTNEEIELMKLDVLRQQFNNYLSDIPLIGCSLIFELLECKKIIHLSDSDKINIYNEQENILKSRLKTNIEMENSHTVKALLKSVVEGNETQKIKLMCYEKCVKDWFKKVESIEIVKNELIVNYK